MRTSVLIMSALLAGSAWAAEPTVDQVYRAASSGHYAQADEMMGQVLKAHPGSAKAHFVEAELKAREGDLAAARQEFDTARRLDPALAFAKPAAVDGLMQRLGERAAPSHAAPSGGESGFPWLAVMVGLGLLAVAMVLFRTRSRPQVISAGSGYGTAPANGYGYPPPSGPMGGMGSGGLGASILGGLATGAAVGAGVVAGEKLMHGLLDDEPRSTPLERSPVPPDTYDMGGNDFGLTDDASWDDNASGGGW